jgi:hypothetical protein
MNTPRLLGREQWKGGHILLAAAVLNSTSLYVLVNITSF